MNDLGNLIARLALGDEELIKKYRAGIVRFTGYTQIYFPVERISGDDNDYIVEDMCKNVYNIDLDDFLISNYNQYVEYTDRNMVVISNVYFSKYIQVVLRCKEKVGVINDYVLNILYDNCVFESGDVQKATYRKCRHLGVNQL